MTPFAGWRAPISVLSRAWTVGLLALGLAACKGDPPADSAPDRASTSVATQSPGGTQGSNGSPSSSTSSSSSNSGSGQPSGATQGGTAGASSRPADAGTKTDAGSPPRADAGGHDAGPPLPTECATDDSGVADDDDGGNPRNCLVVSDLHVQYKAADTNPSDQQVKPHFNLVNHGATAQNLADLSVRYWFSDPSPIEFDFACDYAQIGCGSVQGRVVTVSRPSANRYLELSFSAGTLAGGSQTGEIQARFNHKDWSNLDESDDYSFDPSKTSFADWYRVTLYRGGVLVWGAEP